MERFCVEHHRTQWSAPALVMPREVGLNNQLATTSNDHSVQVGQCAALNSLIKPYWQIRRNACGIGAGSLPLG